MTYQIGKKYIYGNRENLKTVINKGKFRKISIKEYIERLNIHMDNDQTVYKNGTLNCNLK